ncbi:hypothetical protein L1N85_22470, partial [Paenibacillus alkaliterrae]|nr:hypothetical protein [Paenibacillus alkaliterrae]
MEYTYTNQQHYLVEPQQALPAGSDCGCRGPRMLMPQPGGLGGLFPPGPGPFPPGPGPFPP